jgi:hypothetical protein
MLEYQHTTQRVTGTIRNLNGGKGRKIEPLEAEHIAEQYKDDPAALEAQIVKLQIGVYVLCGGGLLSRFAQCQPGEFYIDQRCTVGNRKQIYNAVAVLCVYAAAAGYDVTGLKPDGKKLIEQSIPYAGWILEG